MDKWEQIQPFYVQLLDRKVTTVEDQNKWLQDRSELDSFVSEDMAWRYIRYTRNTQDKKVKKHYDFFINEIQPHIAPFSDQLNRKFYSFFNADNNPSPAHHILYRSIQNDIELFREKNIPLFTTISNEGQKYSSISSKMTITFDQKELTLQQAANYLEKSDRQIRKEVYDKIVDRRLQDAAEIDTLYNILIDLRKEVSENAGFDNFRDYKFKAQDRFDYSIEDNLEFHDSIREEIIPLIREIHLKKKNKLGLEVLRPYDLGAPMPGEVTLQPFQDANELIEKTISSFNALGHGLGNYLKYMKENGFLDLESRVGKAPGGYNYPLAESGIPFIFMNATGKHRDLVTMVHEGGHAIHSFLTRELPLVYFKYTPSEVAELASMSMELISMSQWKVFFKDDKQYKQALRKHLEDILDVLPWVAIIDKFQHWVYTHSDHSVSDRDQAWLDIFSEFSSGVVDFSGYENYVKKLWQKQLHLFEIPFYYIEYAIAQLGAISIWKNYLDNPSKGLSDYLDALKLGYTRSIPEIYKTAGIHFSFEKNYLHELALFIKDQLNLLES